TLTPADVCEHFSPEELLAAVPVDQLVGYAATRVAQDMIPQPAFVPPPAIVTATNGKPKPAYKPCIAVIGPLGGQATTIRERIGDAARLWFAPKDSNIAVTASHADRFIVWTNFVSHRHTDKLRSNVPINRIILHRGGLKNLITRIEQLVRELAIC